MRRILFAICLALLPILILPMVARKSNNHDAEYVSINRVVSYFSTIQDSGVINSLMTNLSTVNNLVSDGYNFGDALKVLGYVNVMSIQFMLIPFQLIGKFVGFIPYYINAT